MYAQGDGNALDAISSAVTSDDSPMKVAVLGIVCLPWCSPGQREGMSHESIEALEVVIAELVTMEFDWALVECSPNMDFKDISNGESVPIPNPH